MKSLLLTVVCLASIGSASATAATTDLTGYIGSHKKTFSAQSIVRSAAFAVSGKPAYLAITEVYPDTPRRTFYRYKVSARGIGTFDRTGVSTGFGPATYFIKVSSQPLGRVTITNTASDRQTRPVVISSVRGIRQDQLKSLLAKDRFVLSGLLPATSREEQDRLSELFTTGVKPPAGSGVGLGLSYELRCANQDAARVKADIQTAVQVARKYKVQMLLGLVTWWSGTPMFVDDGSGGRFGDVKYQQVCYSPDVEAPHNPELAKLLGGRYNSHYRLSVPNQWSSVPWLTMNSPTLNGYRMRRFAEAIGMLKETFEDGSWRGSIFIENEPRYWDTQCVAYDPNLDLRGKTLWADFNPLTVADAARDGVKLDPSDGLSDRELSWLHRNVGSYNQASVDACRAALAANSLEMPLYTHSLQRGDMFPGAAIGHPAGEWAYADGARSGIEGMYSMPSDFWRLREWGRWGDVNREENDGQSIDWHLWDLRVAYMMGADFYNSYNWHAIGAERVIAYMNEFLRDLPVVTLPPAEVRSVEENAFRFTSPMKMQAFTRLEAPVRCAKKVSGTAYIGLVLKDGRAFNSERRSFTLPAGANRIAFDFTTPAECKWGDEALAVLYVSDSSGRFSPGALTVDSGAASQTKLSLDLRTQRALSLAVMSGINKSSLGGK